MRRIDDNNIELTQDELNDIRDFIRNSLYSDWDHYTNNIISTDSVEVGMRRMNPAMYDFADAIESI